MFKSGEHYNVVHNNINVVLKCYVQMKKYMVYFSLVKTFMMKFEMIAILMQLQ